MIDEALFDAEEKMEKAVSVAREDFQSIRTGRANPSMFAKVMVDYYRLTHPDHPDQLHHHARGAARGDQALRG
ncbi:Ribosome-recycling factor [Tsukamurella paurometabola]